MCGRKRGVSQLRIKNEELRMEKIFHSSFTLHFSFLILNSSLFLPLQSFDYLIYGAPLDNRCESPFGYQSLRNKGGKGNKGFCMILNV